VLLPINSGKQKKRGIYVMKHEKRFLKRTVRLWSFALAVCLAGCGSQAKEPGAQMMSEVSENEENPVKEEGSPLDVFGGEEEQATDEDRGGNGVKDGAATGTGAGTEEAAGTEETAEKNEVSGAEGSGNTENDLLSDEDEKSGKISPAQVKERPEGWQMKLSSEDWGLSFGDPGTVPVGNASAEDLAWYSAYYVGDASEKAVYLTFDCGYENGNTEPILDALKKHNAQGTFFVVGHFLETAPEMARRMVEEGHTVGNHTYHHLDMPTISDRETFQEEMDDVADLFYEITGTELSPFYRPPQGKCNVKNLEMAQELGYYTIFWSLAHVDWITDSQPGREEAIDKLTGRVHPGAVVLLHNTSRTNGEILDELLTKWEEMGYSFKPLAELVSG